MRPAIRQFAVLTAAVTVASCATSPSVPDFVVFGVPQPSECTSVTFYFEIDRVVLESVVGPHFAVQPASSENSAHLDLTVIECENLAIDGRQLGAVRSARVAIPLDASKSPLSMAGSDGAELASYALHIESTDGPLAVFMEDNDYAVIEGLVELDVDAHEDRATAKATVQFAQGAIRLEAEFSCPAVTTTSEKSFVGTGAGSVTVMAGRESFERCSGLSNSAGVSGLTPLSDLELPPKAAFTTMYRRQVFEYSVIRGLPVG